MTSSISKINIFDNFPNKIVDSSLSKNPFVLPPAFNNYTNSLYFADFINPLSLIDSGSIYETNVYHFQRRANYGYDKKSLVNINRCTNMKRKGCKDIVESPSKRQILNNPINEYESLSNEIIESYINTSQTQEIYIKKMRLRDVLQTELHKIYAGCYLSIVGSSVNGFGSKSSDMDMCLVIRQNEIDQRMEAPSHLRNIRRVLKKYVYIQKLELINAKVPILKFRDRVSGVEVDLNVNNTVGIQNTYLLHCYSKLDRRVSPLVGIVKMWARMQDINDAKCMTISSYSLTLMVIHYLQCGVSPPVLPSLQKLYPYKFSIHNVTRGNMDNGMIVYVSKNTMAVGELLFGFLNYFTNIFDFSQDAISVRLGNKIPKSLAQNQKSKKNNPGQWKCLCIEEPFDLTNTARSVYDEDIFSRVKTVFQNSFTQLRKTKQLNSILSSF